ncbi:hypothetical protein [Halomontanus rarus]|uniref:hypothetical protein n=1 Tax=Halomontanus rarus TaxID=3034020 RepID=UPI0023E8AFA7|nr:hypothetical protein [Halovivax sp. TS33]
MTTRRKLLGLTAASLTVSVAGCSVIGASTPTISLGEFDVANYCYTPQTIHLLVEEDDEEVYREVIEMKAASDDPDERIDVTYVVPPQPPREAGKYRIYARLDGDGEWTEADLIDPDLECIDMTFEINCGQMGGSSDPHINMMGAVLNPSCPQTE